MNGEKHDLSKFQALNEEEAAAKKNPKERKKIQERRMAMISQEFPSTVALDWKKAFARDRDLYGRIAKDMLKLAQTQPGRPGPRPPLEYGDARREFRRLMGDDYATLPFKEVFQILANGMSMTVLARKVNLDRNLVYKLYTGRKEADIYSMQRIAAAFKKDPSFFLEYRAMYIAGAMLSRLEGAPEASVNLYRKLLESSDGGN